MHIHSAEPPPLPSQAIGRCKPSRKFPRLLFQPLMQSAVALTDRGWFGRTPLKTHVVMCGFQRSGTTLLQLMIETSVRDLRVFGRERYALDAARFAQRNHAYMLTKRPTDIFLVDRIRELYEQRSADVRFVMVMRDPRAVLTSIHQSYPDRYSVSVDRWRAVYEHWTWAAQFEDVTIVRYRDLLTRPERVQQQLSEFVGWTVDRSFESFHMSVPQGFNTRALNGVRPIDRRNLNRWRDDAHRDRMRSLLLDTMPELPQRLIELGYETDDAWVHNYVSRAAA